MIVTGKEAKKALRRIRTKTGWTGRMIAKKLNVSHAAENNIFRGKVANPEPEILRAIDKLLAEVEEL